MGGRATMVRVLATRGIVNLGLPHRIARQLKEFHRWEHGLAGEIRQAAARNPRRVALIDETRHLTYGALVDRADRGAAVLRDLGIAPGDRVGLLARNHIGAVEVLAAAAMLGADAVLLNVGLAPPQIVGVAAGHDLRLVVHDADLGDLVRDLRDGLVRADLLDEHAWRAAVDATPSPDPKAARPPARVGRVIALTSGTTGIPKGAARRTPRGAAPLVSMIERIPAHVGDRVLLGAPLFHTWGFAAFQVGLGIRATMVLRRHFDAARAVDDLRRHRCQGMFAVPVMIQRMLSFAPDRPPADLRYVATSGAAYPTGFAHRFMDAFGEVLHNLYGSTEASWVCIATPADLRRRADTVGTPPLFTTVRILDPDGRPVPEGERGEVWCRNAMVFEGYTTGPSRERREGMVPTGDIGHIEDGLWFVDGRVDDLVVSGGENVYPGEVESLLHDHPLVHDVAVCGVPDPEHGQRLAAFVVLEQGATLTPQDVRAIVRAGRSRHSVPREVLILDALPRNPAGKVLLRELRRLLDPDAPTDVHKVVPNG